MPIFFQLLLGLVEGGAQAANLALALIAAHQRIEGIPIWLLQCHRHRLFCKAPQLLLGCGQACACLWDQQREGLKDDGRLDTNLQLGMSLAKRGQAKAPVQTAKHLLALPKSTTNRFEDKGCEHGSCVVVLFTCES